jgi:hypothetical protein
MVPMSHKLGQWVSTQRKYQTNDEILQDRKDLLDKLGFVWRVDRSALIWKADDELYHSKWKKQYEKLVEFQQKNGHCLVPRKNKDGTSLGSWVLGSWVKYQRTRHAVGKMQPEEVDLLDKLKFDWKADTLAARSSTTTDVRGPVIEAFHASGISCFSFSFCLCVKLCRIRIRKRSPTVWVSQKKQRKIRNRHKVTLLEFDSNVHLPNSRIRRRKRSPTVWVSQKKQRKIRKRQKVTLLEFDSNVHLATETDQVWVSQKKQNKIRNRHKVTLLETDSNVHLPTERDQVSALPRADKKWPHGQTKEAMLRLVVFLWRKMVAVMKKIQNRLW